jgi:hypothetical protein
MAAQECHAIPARAERGPYLAPDKDTLCVG